MSKTYTHGLHGVKRERLPIKMHYLARQGKLTKIKFDSTCDENDSEFDISFSTYGMCKKILRLLRRFICQKGILSLQHNCALINM